MSLYHCLFDVHVFVVFLWAVHHGQDEGNYKHRKLTKVNLHVMSELLAVGHFLFSFGHV